MSFTKIIDDINNVAPAELTGVATGDLPPNTESRAVHVSTGSDGTTLFDLVAATDDGGGVTASATAPDSPAVGDLWYDTDGNGEEDTSSLYIYTEVATGTNAWVATSTSIMLPPAPKESGSYQLVIDSNSMLSWSTPITSSADAPTTPAIGDLWYDTDGSGNEGPSQLYVYTTVDDANSDWVAATPSVALPSLPAQAAAGSYSLVVDDSSNLSWALAESGDSGGDSGGDTGGGSTPTYTTESSYINTQTDEIVIPSAGRWQFIISCHNSSYGQNGRVATPTCTSGFSNITGGYYEWDTIVWTNTNSDIELAHNRHSEAYWDSVAGQFRIVSSPRFYQQNQLGNGNGLLTWGAEYSGSGALAANECMFGMSTFVNRNAVVPLTDLQGSSAPQDTFTNGLGNNGSVMKGELITSDAVTITFYGNSSGTALNNANRVRATLIKIT